MNAGSFISSSKTVRIRAARRLLAVSGEVELVKPLIMLFESPARVLPPGSDRTKPSSCSFSVF